ncbi:MAG: TolC family protein [Gammaproteobacteria bacterium]
MPKTKLTAAAALAGWLSMNPAGAVDLVGVHDLALKNDPVLRAAAFRRDAVGENERQAWAGLLPSLTGGAGMTRGDAITEIAGRRVADVDVDNENWRFDLGQVLYDQANYERLDLARGQVSEAEATYQLTYQDFLLRVSSPTSRC